MPKYSVYLKTGAYARIEVEAEDPDAAVDAAMDEAPDICAQCSGWNREFSLELGDVWDVDEQATDHVTKSDDVAGVELLIGDGDQ